MRAVAFGIGLAGGIGVISVAAANLDDPASPMVTARYIAPPIAPVATSPLDPAEDAGEVSPPGPAAPLAGMPHKHFELALDDARTQVDAVAGRLTGLAADPRLHQEAVSEIARLSAPVARMVQFETLRRSLGEMREVGDKARLVLFAGDQGGVWAYSFTHDTTGVRAAGWSTERADQTGERRIGFAWQKGRARIALTGMERKFCQFGAELKDRVVAMSISFSPGWASRNDHASG
jgi:hypothetical protein